MIIPPQLPSFSPLEKRASYAAYLMALMLLGGAIATTLLPELDLMVASWCYDTYHGFYGAKHPVVVWLYRQSIPALSTAILSSTVLWLVWLVWYEIRTPSQLGPPAPSLPAALPGKDRQDRRASPLWHHPWRLWSYITTSFLLGPGLLVHGWLKTYSGRARPIHLAQFGGEMDFTAAMQEAFGCFSNCSFVSGHAATAFFITAYAALVPPATRPWIWIVGMVCGSLVGMGRIMQGGHFLSDICYAGLIVCGVNAAGFLLLHHFSD